MLVETKTNYGERILFILFSLSSILVILVKPVKPITKFVCAKNHRIYSIDKLQYKCTVCKCMYIYVHFIYLLISTYLIYLRIPMLLYNLHLLSRHHCLYEFIYVLLPFLLLLYFLYVHLCIFICVLLCL